MKQLIEKKSNFEKYSSKALSTDDYDTSLNYARKAIEALCKAIIYHNHGNVIGNSFINGEKTVNNSAVLNPRVLDLNGLITLVTTNNSNYLFIVDGDERNIIKNSMNIIRRLGNSGSHDNSSERNERTNANRQLISATLLYLIDWLYKEFLEEVVPSSLQSFFCEKTTDIANDNHDSLEYFTNNIKEWFSILEYELGSIDYKYQEYHYFDIEIPSRRNRKDKILVLCTLGNIDTNKVEIAEKLSKAYDCIESWIVGSKLVNSSARGFSDMVYCYTFDELIEEDISFETYFEWLDGYVNEKEIPNRYVNLYCEIREEENISRKTRAKEEHELINYTDRWLEYENKEHLSILGDFGTGKTWYCLYYANYLAQKYKTAKQEGLPRPRIPIVIFLRDYAKSINVEGLISDFFFRKHEINFKGAFSAFKFLDKLGKFLIIFDGFDEMSERVNKQKMIDNFWELASIIEPSSKVVLTCRTEHFPLIQEGRSLLNSEFRSTTKKNSIKNLKFDTAYLKLLKKEQLKEILDIFVDEGVVNELLNNAQIFELLKRPIMLDLILESLPNLNDLNNSSLTMIYYFATKNKLVRDIKEERTFTSLKDKFFFMSELSQEMLQTNKLSISYKEFPDKIKEYFSDGITDDEIDYWRYDMHGQSLIIIDEEGQYKPAHKSFLEFFFTFKSVAMLGVLKKDLFEMFGNYVEQQEKVYGWDEYFSVNETSELENLNNIKYKKESDLKEILGAIIFTKPMCEFAVDLIDWDKKTDLLDLLNKMKGKDFEDSGYLVTNLIQILLLKDATFLSNNDLSNMCIRGLDVSKIFGGLTKSSEISIQNTTFENSDLLDSRFDLWGSSPYIFNNSNFDGATLSKIFFMKEQINQIMYLSKEGLYIVGGPNALIILDENLSVIKKISATAWHIFTLNKKSLLIVSGWFNVSIYNFEGRLITEIPLTNTTNNFISIDEDNGWTRSFVYIDATDELWCISGNSTFYTICLKKFKEKSYHLLKQTIRKMIVTESNNIFLVDYDNKIINYSSENCKINSELSFKEDKYLFISKYDFLIHCYSNQVIFSTLIGEKKEIVYTSDTEMTFSYFDQKNEALYCICDKEIIIITVDSIHEYEVKVLPFNNNEIGKMLGNHLFYEKLFGVEENKILVSNGRDIYIYSINENIVEKHFALLKDFSKTTFKKCKGLENGMLEIIEKNGGII